MRYEDLFFYKDGQLYWKIKRRGLQHNRPVGTLNKNYKWIKTNLLPKQVGVHRVVWEMHNGPIPDGYVVDHIDRDTLNNKIENLRLATRSQNCMNAKGKCHKASNLPKNVYVDWVYKDKIKYRAQILSDGISYRRGGFDTIAEAKLAAKELRLMYHGNFSVKEEDDE